jgi:hypothetical protein
MTEQGPTGTDRTVLITRVFDAPPGSACDALDVWPQQLRCRKAR